MAYPLGSHPFDLKVSNLGKNKEKQLKKTHVIQINGLSTSHTQEFHHLHTNIHIYTLHFIHAIHISTRTCHIHHKRRVTEVWHLGHFWLSYGRCAMSGSPLGMLLGLSWREADQATSSKNLPFFIYLGVFMALLLYTIWMSHRVIPTKADYDTCGTMCHM